ncbi:MAG: hypothetical protein Q7T96_01590 [Methylobacter sp.]|nr:hypothetical protein [Methylobacter sp.]
MDILGPLFGVLLFFAIGAAISRWIFRVNDIVDRLDEIIKILGQQNREK